METNEQFEGYMDDQQDEADDLSYNNQYNYYDEQDKGQFVQQQPVNDPAFQYPTGEYADQNTFNQNAAPVGVPNPNLQYDRNEMGAIPKMEVKYDLPDNPYEEEVKEDATRK